MGGHALNRQRLGDETHTFAGRFHDIAPDERIVFAYDTPHEREHGWGELLDALAGAAVR